MSIKSWAIFLTLMGIAALVFLLPVLSGPAVKIKDLPDAVAAPNATPVSRPEANTGGRVLVTADVNVQALATGICTGIVSSLYQVSLPTGFVSTCTKTANSQTRAALRRCEHMGCPAADEIANRIRSELTASLCSKMDPQSGCERHVAGAVRTEFARL
ncbi:MAG: hypothetical protein ACFB6R_07340 [Alphaproteobacteria bacterium]